MARARFQQRCALCKKNMVQMYSTRQFPICVDCHMKKISSCPIEPQYQELLNIPEQLYRQSLFLRNIKESCYRFGNLTEKQIEAFKKTIEDLKHPQPEEPPEPIEITTDLSRRKKKVTKR